MAAAAAAYCLMSKPWPASHSLSRPASHPKLRGRSRARRGAARQQQPTAKMDVPSDVFKGLAAEERAAQSLVLICTAVAIR